MNEIDEKNTNQKTKTEMPILQLNRLKYARINGRILESTNTRLDKYISFATERMKTEITAGDVIEHGLKLLFERDIGFKDWLKKN
jgi:hypothetical protein